MRTAHKWFVLLILRNMIYLDSFVLEFMYFISIENSVVITDAPNWILFVIGGVNFPAPANVPEKRVRGHNISTPNSTRMDQGRRWFSKWDRFRFSCLLVQSVKHGKWRIVRHKARIPVTIETNLLKKKHIIILIVFSVLSACCSRALNFYC